MKKVVQIIFLVVISVACQRNEAFFDPVPVISLEGVDKTTIVQFQDSLVISLNYVDGDGDLGFFHPDSNALRVLDSRLSTPDWYFVPPLAPESEVGLSIDGELNFKLSGTYLIGGSDQEQTTFTIAIRDRMGNWSNEVETEEITIVKEE